MSFLKVDETPNEYIAQVNSIWSVQGHFFVHVTKLERSGIDSFYKMRQFIKTTHTQVVQPHLQAQDQLESNG
ncbi:hypothetical protein PGT21_009124 [Puccinia graminis f. sp. tritici]|uniref:Uncharacterized protein n=1 Tax=Puccinia graminis f. sp. tritici TaxID=56615 RepID=A0A5B0N068_PUCGR|nr:hypothetical protein PGT21_009124 [Puccinia graminis f. sp. tritici]KAA1133461.1 hypothetical protein PGTUg99_014821 [Puccinia graminis f. sp. tritici]